MYKTYLKLSSFVVGDFFSFHGFTVSAGVDARQAFTCSAGRWPLTRTSGRCKWGAVDLVFSPRLVGFLMCTLKLKTLTFKYGSWCTRSLFGNLFSTEIEAIYRRRNPHKSWAQLRGGRHTNSNKWFHYVSLYFVLGQFGNASSSNADHWCRTHCRNKSSNETYPWFNLFLSLFWPTSLSTSNTQGSQMCLQCWSRETQKVVFFLCFSGRKAADLRKHKGNEKSLYRKAGFPSIKDKLCGRIQSLESLWSRNSNIHTIPKMVEKPVSSAVECRCANGTTWIPRSAGPSALRFCCNEPLALARLYSDPKNWESEDKESIWSQEFVRNVGMCSWLISLPSNIHFLHVHLFLLFGHRVSGCEGWWWGCCSCVQCSFQLRRLTWFPSGPIP